MNGVRKGGTSEKNKITLSPIVTQALESKSLGGLKNTKGNVVTYKLVKLDLLMLQKTIKDEKRQADEKNLPTNKIRTKNKRLTC